MDPHQSVRPARCLAAIVFLFLLVACGQDTGRPLPAAQAEATATSAPTFTPTPRPTFRDTSPPSSTTTPTATATATATPTVTPTSTAPPAAVAGAPRPSAATTPEPQFGVPCGLAALFDYPISPPDADNGRLRQEYANERRPGSYHTGEDWTVEGGASFGEPVYSAGHGQVIYAAPNGWGTDRGVVIVEHTFDGGSTLLSFYGHLDPPSVVLRAGQCVTRGEQVGEIGRPRTPPHLHFELRTHMPEEPGPGYWGPDLTRAGWRPPSRIIWNLRHGASAGVEWIYPFSFRYMAAVGPLRDNSFALLEPHTLSGIDLTYGRRRWRLAPAERFVGGLASSDRAMLYLVDASGQILAVSIPPMEEDAETFPPPPARAWTHTLPVTETAVVPGSAPTLMPLPGAGVLVSTWTLGGDDDSGEPTGQRRMVALSPSGDLLWEEALPAPALWTTDGLRWALAGDRLLFSASGPEGGVWEAGQAGITLWTTEVTGQPIPRADGAFIYARDGVYHLQNGKASARLLYPLPHADLEQGDALVLPDGGLLLAHHNRRDRRLILLNDDGSLRWQRSLSALVGAARLLLLDGRPYLTLQDDTTDVTKLNVYALDLETATLTHLFAGGGISDAHQPAPPITPFAASGRLLLPIHGSGLVILDPQAAASGAVHLE